MNHCERLAQEAMKADPGGSAWKLWEAHGQTCPTCRKDQAVWAHLQNLAEAPSERLGQARMRHLQKALAAQHRKPGKSWSTRFLALAGVAAVIFITVWFLPEREPFSLTDPPSRWTQIAANPDWDLKQEHPLRNRIQTLRNDFRVKKTPSEAATENKKLKARLQRFRDDLNSEF